MVATDGFWGRSRTYGVYSMVRFLQLINPLLR